MRNYLLFLLLTISILAHSQEKDSNNKQKIQIEKTNGPTPWTSLNLNNNPGKFQFAIIPDRTGGHRPGVFMDAVNKLNLLQPEFVMSIGDLIEGYSTNIDQLNRQWDEFDSFVKQLEMPFFYLPGNHDFTNQVMEDLWKKRLGSSYYHFIYKDVLFLMLNSEDQKLGDGKGTISDPQYKFVQQILTKYPDVKWTIVFMHQPLWHQTETRHWKNVEKLLANRKHTVFAGHEHRYVKEDRNNGKYFILATTGGYSPLRGKELGEFDHIVWVSMTENGPIISNLQLDGILNENIVTKPIQDYIDLVSTKSPLQIKPIYKEKEHLKSEIIEVKITNDENVPMHVKFTEDCCYDLVGIPKRNELTIAPNSLEVVKLKVKTEITTHEKPIKIKAYVLYQFENIENKPQIQFSYNIKALKPYRLTKINREIKIDGLFNDWSNLPQNWASEDNKIGVSFDVG
ncbi:MAG: metallophosphoesterase, partial [Bacteroidota bacterium]